MNLYNMGLHQQAYPSMTFLSELKQTLTKRKQELEEEQNLVYKEFDPTTGKFTEISKNEREQKTWQLDLKLQELREQEAKEKRETELYRQTLVARAKKGNSGVSDLFAELTQKVKSKEVQGEVIGGDEVYE